MPLRLREYRTKDRESVVALDEIVLAELDALGLPRKFDDLDDIESEYLPNGAFVVAQSDAEIIGMGGIRFYPDKTARINRMRVHPDKQGSGIGKMILAWLEARADDAATGKIVLNTLAIQKNAQRLYESFGYVKVGEGAPDGFAIYMYEKEIKPKPATVVRGAS